MDEASRFPLSSKVALQDVYMDDVVSGAQTLDTARQLQCQLQNMLKTCGMKSHKWNSNSKELFNSSTDQEHSFSTNTESAIKTLGVSWKPTGDYFMFKVSIPSIASYTKKDVLSVIARLYDPLGLIGPVISKAKIFLLKLWLRKLNWEECLPEAIAPEWLNFVSSLKALEELKIDRYLLTNSYEKLMLLGYADASESAYGAVVYMHCVKEDGQAYDSAATMAGCYTGVQQRIKDNNPDVEFVPCSNHSINLVCVHAASVKPIKMFMPKAHRIAVFEYLFKEGVMVAKKDFNAPKHPDIENVPNLHVIKTLQSLKSKGLVKEQFSWRHYYWYLTNEGIQYLREVLNLPPEIVPATLKRQVRPETTRQRPR
ncbi:40S ribosomal protein S10b, partial [Trichonephila clavata]